MAYSKAKFKNSGGDALLPLFFNFALEYPLQYFG
jgi:hypothetical protein